MNTTMYKKSVTVKSLATYNSKTDLSLYSNAQTDVEVCSHITVISLSSGQFFFHIKPWSSVNQFHSCH